MLSTRAVATEADVPAGNNVPATPAVQVSGLVKTYDGRRAVDGLSLAACSGRLTAVLGPNGAGKTTTIECCEGLRTPDEGRVRVLGLAPRDRRLRSRVGVMLQDSGLPSGARAMEVLRHLGAMHDHPRDLSELAERLALDAFADTTVRRLSGGQRQRLALAVAVVGRPDLVFLDEPSAGMDPQSRHAVWDLIRELRATGTSLVLTTHLMDEAEALADDVVIVDHGRVVATGTVAELVAPPGRESHSTLRLRTRGTLDVTRLNETLAPQASTTEQRPGEYLVTGAMTPDTVALIARCCADQDVLITELGSEQRTLEDAFLDLTGRSLRG